MEWSCGIWLGEMLLPGHGDYNKLISSLSCPDGHGEGRNNEDGVALGGRTV